MTSVKNIRNGFQNPRPSRKCKEDALRKIDDNSKDADEEDDFIESDNPDKILHINVSCFP